MSSFPPPHLSVCPFPVFPSEIMTNPHPHPRLLPSSRTAPHVRMQCSSSIQRHDVMLFEHTPDSKAGAKISLHHHEFNQKCGEISGDRTIAVKFDYKVVYFWRNVCGNGWVP